MGWFTSFSLDRSLCLQMTHRWRLTWPYFSLPPPAGCLDSHVLLQQPLIYCHFANVLQTHATHQWRTGRCKHISDGSAGWLQWAQCRHAPFYLKGIHATYVSWWAVMLLHKVKMAGCPQLLFSRSYWTSEPQLVFFLSVCLLGFLNYQFLFAIQYKTKFLHEIYVILKPNVTSNRKEKLDWEHKIKKIRHSPLLWHKYVTYL